MFRLDSIDFFATSGTLYHIKSTTILGQQEAQHVFRQYQLDANSGSLNFQRLPLRSHKCEQANSVQIIG